MSVLDPYENLEVLAVAKYQVLRNDLTDDDYRSSACTGLFEEKGEAVGWVQKALANWPRYEWDEEQWMAACFDEKNTCTTQYVIQAVVRYT